MGKYAIHNVIWKDLKEDGDIAETWVRSEIVRMATEAGYHPKPGPQIHIDWSEITEIDARLNPVWNGFEIRAGDWRVRAVIEVEENHEL